MKQTTTTLLLACALFSVASCKKDKKTTTPDSEPVVNCDLASEIISDDTTTYEYDTENRLVRQLDNGSVSITVEYLDNGNTVRETETDAINTYQLNDQGFPTTMLTESNNGGRSRTYYTYDANGFCTKILSHSVNAQDSILAKDSVVFTNTVANQNLVNQVGAGAFNLTIASTHDLNRPNNLPDPTPYQVQFFTGGRKDKNLTITTVLTNNNNNQSQTANYSYQYDSKGRITRKTSIVYSGNPTSYDTLHYKYRCD